MNRDPSSSSFWTTLWAQPSRPHSLLSRYTVANGALYLLIGGAMYLVPGPVLIRMFNLTELVRYEEGLVRSLGVTIAIIGWFYVMGGRTRADSFGLSTVLDRLLLPFLLLPLWFSGLAARSMVLPFAVLDPLLGFGAYLVWRRETARVALT